MKKKEGLKTIPVSQQEYAAFRRVAEERVKPFADLYLLKQRYAGNVMKEPMTVLDLVCAVYLQGVWDGVQLVGLRPEILEVTKRYLPLVLAMLDGLLEKTTTFVATRF